MQLSSAHKNEPVEDTLSYSATCPAIAASSIAPSQGNVVGEGIKTEDHENPALTAEAFGQGY